MNIQRCVAVVVAVSLLSLARTALADIQKGQSVRSPVEIGRLRVPLPPGEWLVIGEHEGRVTVDGTPSGGNWKGFYLVQQDADKRFIASFYLRASLSSSRVNWSDSTCDRKDTLYRDTLEGNMKVPECLLMNHFTRFMQAVPSGPFDRANWEWFQASGLHLPKTALGVFTRFYRFGDFLYVNYWIDPEGAPIGPSTAAEWSESEWHPALIAKSPDRKALADRLKTWGLATAKVHRAVLAGDAAPAELPALPR